jgi:hypothetical protein
VTTSVFLFLNNSNQNHHRHTLTHAINQDLSLFYNNNTMARQHKTSATSRERNRIHARKTRQRKKEQMQSLQQKAEQLKNEQVQLKLAINEKNTASILCCLFSKDDGKASSAEDPRIEALLKRSTDDIPDSSKLPALQPLILPSGAQHSKKSKAASVATAQQELPDDGIDYELLGKDRSTCTTEELERIRRERNRMHAKRTRDRKRLFMEEMAEMCKTLETENMLLQRHLIGLNGGVLPSHQQHLTTSVTISPSLSSVSPPPPLSAVPTGFREFHGIKRVMENNVTPKTTVATPTATKHLGQLDTLLQAAGAATNTCTSTRTYHPYSSGSEDEDDEAETSSSAFKRRRLNAPTAGAPKSLIGV